MDTGSYKVALHQKDVHFPKEDRDEKSSSLLVSWISKSPWPEVSHLLEGNDVTIGIWCKIRTDPAAPQSLSSTLQNSQGVLNRIYHPLPSPRHIRLLEVQSGPVVGTIKGHLLAVSLEDRPDFKALSYVWGDTECTEIIECNGEYLKITYNAATAIRHHRSSRQSILLWVDCICINQIDMLERSSQVQLMPQIYREASEVDIWLNERTGSSDLGMEILDHLVGSGNRPNEPPPWKQKAPQLLQEGLRDVMERDWWSRGWTVQEMALSSRTRITCGPCNISWTASADRVREIIRNIKLAEISYAWSEAGLTSTSLQPFLSLLQEQLKQISPSDSGPSNDIVDIMYSFRDKHFTDQRDKIYAMLGLVSDVEIQPDYNLNVEETWNMFLTAVDKRHNVDRANFSTTTGEEPSKDILSMPGLPKDLPHRKRTPMSLKRWLTGKDEG